MVRVRISRRDTADTATTAEPQSSSLHMSLSPGTEVGNGSPDTEVDSSRLDTEVGTISNTKSMKFENPYRSSKPSLLKVCIYCGRSLFSC